MKPSAYITAMLAALLSFSCNSPVGPDLRAVWCQTDRTDYVIEGYLGMDTVKAAIVNYLADTIAVVNCNGTFTLQIYARGAWSDYFPGMFDCAGWFTDLAPDQSMHDSYELFAPVNYPTGFYRMRFSYSENGQRFAHGYSNPFRIRTE